MLTLLTDKGLGVASFAVLVYGGYKIIQLIQTLATNHLTHLQETLDKIASSQVVTNERLGHIIEKLEK